MKIKVQGLKELDAALGQLRTKAMAKGVVKRALFGAAEPMHQMAQDAAPGRDDPNEKIYYGRGANRRERRPGTTKALVQIGDRLTRRQASQARKAGKHFVEIYVGTRDAKAHLEEIGSVNQAATPFMRTAFSNQAEPTINRFVDTLSRELEKAAAREAKRTARLARKGKT
jgi:HK97 gp10 family phage protein